VVSLARGSFCKCDHSPPWSKDPVEGKQGLRLVLQDHTSVGESAGPRHQILHAAISSFRHPSSCFRCQRNYVSGASRILRHLPPADPQNPGPVGALGLQERLRRGRGKRQDERVSTERPVDPPCQLGLLRRAPSRPTSATTSASLSNYNHTPLPLGTLALRHAPSFQVLLISADAAAGSLAQYGHGGQCAR